ncbi:MAG TPA: DUF2062 domain-containing protein [Thermoanaerobaculia bacterium]|nr:DUF2062 domain-containing protein [Thermoanaerobaculia bacterium]
MTGKKGFRARFMEMLGRDDPPEMVAASFALGVAISFTPLVGFHWILALSLAVVLKLNKVDVLLGTLVVNPLTIGPIAAVAIPIGRLVLRAEREALSHLPWKELLNTSFWAHAAPRMRAIGLQWAAGMLILSLVAGALTYIVLVNVIRAHRARLAAAAALPPGAIPEHGAPEEDEEIPPSPS